MKVTGFLVALALLLGAALPATAQTYEPTWESLDSRPIPEWFTDAKFGIFIHWGVYSVPAWISVTEGKYASYAEWYYARVMGELKGDEDFHERTFGENFEYRDFAPLFTAELFDPDLWASLFVESGARYVVLTSKHHDGFCLWPTKSPFKKNWNSMDVGPKRDLVGDLTRAVRARGIRMGLYYSMIEWETNRTGRTPSGRFIPQEAMDRYGIPLDRYVDDHVLPQLKELVTEYEPAVIFSDAGEWDETEEFWKTREFLAWLYNNAPNRDEVVVNDRWARGMVGQHGDYYSSEYQDLEGVGAGHPWEESRGMGRSYGYNRAENINHYRTSKELVHELIDVVSRGGNLLLNVNQTQRYDLSSDTWEVGPEFTSRRALAALSITASRLYAQGGDSNGGGGFDATDLVEYLDLAAWPGGTWTDLSDPLPQANIYPAGACTAAFTGGEIWAVGGGGATSTPYTSTRYRPAEACLDYTYTFSLEPEAQSGAGFQGDLVDYNLTITHSGDTPDAYTATVTSVWTTTVSGLEGALDPGLSRTLTVTVAVPAEAIGGDSDTADVTLTSQGDPTQQDSASLTTEALVNGIALRPSSAAQAALPGETITYTLQLSNTGEVTDTFTLSAGESQWTVTLSLTETTLAAGGAAEITVLVAVPGGALEGAMDQVLIIATSQGDPGVSAGSTLTTTVWWRSYLPIVRKE